MLVSPILYNEKKHALRVSLVIATVAKVMQAGLWLVVRVKNGCPQIGHPPYYPSLTKHHVLFLIRKLYYDIWIRRYHRDFLIFAWTYQIGIDIDGIGGQI